MERIRKGNDIEIQWAIYAGKGINEAPYDLAGKNVSLYLKNQFGTTEVYEYSVEKHVVSFMFWGKDQKQTGVYSLMLVENEGRRGMHTVDECDAFNLVSHSCDTGGESEGRVECVHLQFRSNMGVFMPALGSQTTVDASLSLESENPVQNKVITLALQQETQRATDAENRLEQLIGDYDSKLEHIEDALEVTDKTVQNLMVKIDNVDDKLERIENAIEGVDLNAVATVLTKVETLETDVKELEQRVETLHADANTEGSVDNKIAQALDWENVSE